SRLRLCGHLLYLPSFPTRRSSDLIRTGLRETINTLSTTSMQIASAIEQHEQTAISQAAAVNQTTATMDQLDASFSQTADMVKTRSEEHTSELQSPDHLVCRLLLEK